MDANRIRLIKSNLETIETKELFDIWMENDRKKRSPEAFEAITQLLTERGLDLNLFTQNTFQKESKEEITYAGFWKRLAAHFVDSIVLFVFHAILAYGYYLFIFSKIYLEFETLPTAHLFGFYFLSFIISWLYFAIMESSSRQGTYGKNIVGIKVTDIYGDPISFMKATIRYFAKIVSGMTFFVGYLMAGFTAKKQALHDIMSECLVIDQ